jgi:hypothetical protein
MLFFGPHSWRGESGRRYRFKCVLTKQGLPPEGVGGIYVFVRRRFAFFLEPLYVGKAADLRSRLLGHEKWGRATGTTAPPSATCWGLSATRWIAAVSRKTSSAA